MNSTLKSQAGYLFAGRLTSFFIRFIIPVILVRLFTKEEYGLYQQIMLVSLFFVPTVQFGMATSLFYFYSIAKEKFTQLMSQTFYFIVFSGMIFFPIFYLFRYKIAHFFQNDNFVEYILPCGLYIFFYASSIILEYLFILEKKSRLVFSYLVLSQFVRASLIIFCLLLFRTVIAVIWGLVFFSSLRVLILYLYLKINYKISIKSWDRKLFFAQFKYSLPLGLTKIVGDLGKKIDRIIISGLLTASDFAIYSVASFKIPLLELFYPSIRNVALPKLSELCFAGKKGEAIKLWHKMIISFSVVTFPLLVFFFIMAPLIITFLYSDEYVASVLIYRIFLFILLVEILSYGVIIKAYNKTKFIFISNLISMFVGIVLGYLLIKRFGLVGGAVSAVITYSINAWIQLFIVKATLDLKFSLLLPWKKMGVILLYSMAASPILLLIYKLAFPKIVVLILSSLFYGLIIALLFIQQRIINFRIIQKKLVFRGFYD